MNLAHLRQQGPVIEPTPRGCTGGNPSPRVLPKITSSGGVDPEHTTRARIPSLRIRFPFLTLLIT